MSTLTVPNPDYGSTDKNAIGSDLQKIRVYHKNAKRLENAGLAAPYNLEVGPWCVNDTSVTGLATVDAGKNRADEFKNARKGPPGRFTFNR